MYTCTYRVVEDFDRSGAIGPLYVCSLTKRNRKSNNEAKHVHVHKDLNFFVSLLFVVLLFVVLLLVVLLFVMLLFVVVCCCCLLCHVCCTLADERG